MRKRRPYRCYVCGSKLEVAEESDEVLVHPCVNCRQELRKEAEGVKHQSIQHRIDQAVDQALAKERADLASHWKTILNTGSK
jgi:DNA-directed RNA polymerase subunit RPC12/RpoP